MHSQGYVCIVYILKILSIVTYLGEWTVRLYCDTMLMTKCNELCSRDIRVQLHLVDCRDVLERRGACEKLL